MTLPTARPVQGDGSATRVRWAAAAAMIAGMLLGGALFLRPLLDIQLDTPESIALALASALGRLLFVVALVGVHLVYGHAYGLLGRIVVWSLAVLTAVSLVSLLFTFGLLEAGSPLAAVGNVATPLSFLLVSVLGTYLAHWGENRLAGVGVRQEPTANGGLVVWGERNAVHL